MSELGFTSSEETKCALEYVAQPDGFEFRDEAGSVVSDPGFECIIEDDGLNELCCDVYDEYSITGAKTYSFDVEIRLPSRKSEGSEDFEDLSAIRTI